VGWALFSSFGLLGSVDGFWAIFPCLVYHGSPVLLGFGPLVDHCGVGFGPWWTGKNRPLQLSRNPNHQSFSLRISMAFFKLVLVLLLASNNKNLKPFIWGYL
jgi:hypothetical protein